MHVGAGRSTYGLGMHVGAGGVVFMDIVKDNAVSLKGIKERVFILLLQFSGWFVVGMLAVFMYYIFSNGLTVIDWEFLSEFPRNDMMEGGIYPAIYGTFFLMLLTMIFALPLGIASAIYLSEYANQGPLTRAIRLAINNLAGVPSIVFGLVGLGFFVIFMNMGFSLLAASLTLSILILPLVIRASEEALKAVPPSLREASMALGATKWQTIKHHTLPYSGAGILTGAILALSRAAGETAPIMLTGVAYYTPSLPSSTGNQFMALPYHIFVMATQAVNTEEARPIQFGTVVVLLSMILIMNFTAIYLRNRLRKKYRW